MTHYLPGSDDDQDFLAAMDFSAADDDSGVDAADDALHTYSPAEVEDTASELGEMRSEFEATEEDDAPDDVAVFTVTNPALTVSVSALMDGRIRQFDLSPKLTAASESDLADEILAIADLARQKGLAGLHTLLLENESELGLDGSGALPDFVKSVGMEVPSPEEAGEAQAEVFAARYATGK